MNRYKQIMTCTQIRELVQKKQYKDALELMDKIELERFRTRVDQLDFIEVYLHTMRYEDARDLLLPLYDYYPTCHVIHSLFFVSIKLQELEDASEYLLEYQERAPKDPERLVMEYTLARDRGLERQELIPILERLKQEEYTKIWGYELAKLYHKEGRKEECIQECNDLIIWFQKGRIVNKAITLKQLYLGTATIPLDEIQKAIKDKEEEADKLIEEVTRVCKDLYEDVSMTESSEESAAYDQAEPLEESAGYDKAEPLEESAAYDQAESPEESTAYDQAESSEESADFGHLETEKLSVL